MRCACAGDRVAPRARVPRVKRGARLRKSPRRRFIEGWIGVRQSTYLTALLCAMGRKVPGSKRTAHVKACGRIDSLSKIPRDQAKSCAAS